MNEKKIQRLYEKLDESKAPGQRIEQMMRLGLELIEVGRVADLQKILEEAAGMTFDDPKDELRRDGWQNFCMAALQFYKANHEQSVIYIEKSFESFRLADDLAGMAEALVGKGMSLWTLGDFNESLDTTFEALRLYQTANRPEREAMVWYLLGTFHYDLKDYSSSEKYFSKSLELSYVNDENMVSRARSRIGLSNIAMINGDFEKAINYLKEAAEIQEEINDTIGFSRNQNDLGVVYRKMKKYDQARLHLERAVEIRRKLSFRQGLITSLTEIGLLETETGQFAVAEKTLFEAAEIADEIHAKAKLFRIYRLLSENYEVSGRTEEAFEFFKKFYTLKDDVVGERSGLKIKSIENKLELERREAESEIYRLKNVELKKAHDVIEDKNRKIIAGINYAKRIQDAVLPQLSEVRKLLPESFVFYKPRDIVSGDFYRFSEVIDSEGRKKIVIVAADCTGHGVPGAFMSLIGNDLLNEILLGEKCTDPAGILERLHAGIRKSLNQAENTNRDGMDAAICSLDTETGDLWFAGAKNPLITIRKGELKRFKGSRFSLGGSVAEPDFQNRKIDYEVGTDFYLFSDGFQDQFGGPEGRKYLSTNFRNLLGRLSEQAVFERADLLENELSDWTNAGNYKQTDDILTIGFRL